jgi:hypothetical protein
MTTENVFIANHRIIIFTSLAIDVSTGMISHSFVHGLSAVLTFVIGGAR